MLQRTTIRLPDALLKEAKHVALQTGRTLTAVIEDALRESLARHVAPSRKPRDFTTFDGNGLRPGIDLDNTSELLEAMEQG